MQHFTFILIVYYLSKVVAQFDFMKVTIEIVQVTQLASTILYHVESLYKFQIKKSQILKVKSFWIKF